MNTIERGFRQAIEKDAYDQASRLVFADWLDENDRPEEAEIQRAWSAEKQKAAEDYFDRLSLRISNSDWGAGTPMTREDVIEAALNYLDNGEPSYLPMNNDGIGADYTGELWVHLGVLTDRVCVPPRESEDTEDWDAGEGCFRCAC